MYPLHLAYLPHARNYPYSLSRGLIGTPHSEPVSVSKHGVSAVVTTCLRCYNQRASKRHWKRGMTTVGTLSLPKVVQGLKLQKWMASRLAQGVDFATFGRHPRPGWSTRSRTFPVSSLA